MRGPGSADEKLERLISRKTRTRARFVSSLDSLSRKTSLLSRESLLRLLFRRSSFRVLFRDDFRVCSSVIRVLGDKDAASCQRTTGRLFLSASSRPRVRVNRVSVQHALHESAFSVLHVVHAVVSGIQICRKRLTTVRSAHSGEPRCQESVLDKRVPSTYSSAVILCTPGSNGCAGRGDILRECLRAACAVRKSRTRKRRLTNRRISIHVAANELDPPAILSTHDRLRAPTTVTVSPRPVSDAARRRQTNSTITIRKRIL